MNAISQAIVNKSTLELKSIKITNATKKYVKHEKLFAL